MRKSKDKKIELNFSEKQLFSKILNVYMPKTFDWWKKIVIDDAYIRLYDNMNILVIQSRINVDREWAGESYYEWNGHRDRKSTRLNSSHVSESRMPSSA